MPASSSRRACDQRGRGGRSCGRTDAAAGAGAWGHGGGRAARGLRHPPPRIPRNGRTGSPGPSWPSGRSGGDGGHGPAWPPLSSCACGPVRGARCPPDVVASRSCCSSWRLGSRDALDRTVARRRASGHPSVSWSRSTRCAATAGGPEGPRRMPRLHALASEGTAFTEAMATAPWTLPPTSRSEPRPPFDHDVRTMRSTIPLESPCWRSASAMPDTAPRPYGGRLVSSAFGYRPRLRGLRGPRRGEGGRLPRPPPGRAPLTRARRGEPFFLSCTPTAAPPVPAAGGSRGRGRVSSSFTVADAERSTRAAWC